MSLDYAKVRIRAERVSILLRPHQTDDHHHIADTHTHTYMCIQARFIAAYNALRAIRIPRMLLQLQLGAHVFFVFVLRALLRTRRPARSEFVRVSAPSAAASPYSLYAS